MRSSIFKNRILPSEGARHLFIIILCITVFYIIAFRGILFNSDHVYQTWDNSIPPFSIQVQHLTDISKSTWWSSIDMGTPGVWTGMTRYFDLLVLKGLSLFLDGKHIIKWLYLFYALIGGTGFWLICRSLGWGLYTTLMVILISQFNPKTYTLAVSGHMLHQGFAYSLVPWFLFMLYKALNTSSIWMLIVNILCAGIIGSLIFSASPFGVVYFGIFTVLFFIAFGFGKHWWRISIYLIAVFAMVAVLHIYWLAPAKVLSGEAEAFFKFSETVEKITDSYIGMYKGSSANFFNAVIGHIDANDTGREYAYPVIAAKSLNWPWKFSAYFLLLIAISGVFFKSKYRDWKFFSMLCLAGGIILFAGSNTPAGKLLYEGIILKIKMVFFLMARTSRWLLVYYMGFAMMIGFTLDGIGRINGLNKRFFRGLRIFFLCILTVYLFPYWTGSLSMPKNRTTSTLALVPQEVNSEEAEVAERLSGDVDDYRIAIFPTLITPLGNIPHPPKKTYGRNGLLFGKDAVNGHTYTGAKYSQFLMNLIHRKMPYTDNLGKMLGLVSVKRLLYARDEKYSSFLDFGYMLKAKESHEPIYDPDGVLERLVSAQTDLSLENKPEWKFKELDIYLNENFLPRIRTVESAYLATGGFPLFASMSELPLNFFKTSAVFFGTDLDEISIKNAMPYWKGVIIYNNSWPELFLPFLQKDYWYAADSVGGDKSDGWNSLQGIWHTDLWLDGSVLNEKGLMSEKKAELSFHLKGIGRHRLLVRYGRMMDSGKIDFIFNGYNIASVKEGEIGYRSFVWKDLGVVNLDAADDILKIDTAEAGTAISGFLLVPENVFYDARKKMEEVFFNEKNIQIIAEAETVVSKTGSIKGDEIIIPLLHDANGRVEATMSSNVKELQWDDFNNKYLKSEGNQVAEVVFKISFGDVVAGCKMESYPRIGSDDGSSFVKAYFSKDGVHYQQLHNYISSKNKHVYGYRQEDLFDCESSSIFIKFQIKNGELYSFITKPQFPMRVIGEVKNFKNVAKSFGYAVSLPAQFTFHIPKEGNYHIMGRVIGKEGDRIDMSAPQIKKALKLEKTGASWLDMGVVKVNSPGPLNISLAGDKDIYCDLFKIELNPRSANIKTDDGLTYHRINPANYSINLEQKTPSLLLFSENFNPKWFLKIDDKLIEPIKAFGFMNAYPVYSAKGNHANLYFKYQVIRDYYWKVSRIGWIIVGIGLMVCCVALFIEKRRSN